MKRDILINELLAAEAQLRRTLRLAHNIKSADEIAARLPPMVEQTQRSLASLASRIRQQEGGRKP